MFSCWDMHAYRAKDINYLFFFRKSFDPWSKHQFSSVQPLSRVRLFVTPWIVACQASLSITNSQSWLKLTSIKSVMPSSHLIFCHPLLFLPPIPPSIRVFSNVSTFCMSWPKYWSFSFSISPSKEHPGLISFRLDWLDLHTMEYYSPLKEKEILPFVMSWMNLEGIMLSDINQTQKDKHYMISFIWRI